MSKYRESGATVHEDEFSIEPVVNTAIFTKAHCQEVDTRNISLLFDSVKILSPLVLILVLQTLNALLTVAPYLQTSIGYERGRSYQLRNCFQGAEAEPCRIGSRHLPSLASLPVSCKKVQKAKNAEKGTET